ncbi:MAG: CpaF family protein [bacterium]|nr:CpaF family protein [bacterium]
MSSFIQRKLNEQAAKDAAKSMPDSYSGGNTPGTPALAAPSAAPASDSRPAMPAPPASDSRPAMPAPAHEAGQKRRTPARMAYLRKLLRPKLLKTPDEADTWHRDDAEKVALITDRLKQLVSTLGEQRPELRVSGADFTLLAELLCDDLLGFGAIDPLIRSRECSEVMVNGPEIVFGEFKGRLTETDIVWDDEDHIQWTAHRIVRPLSRQLNRENPMVDARLPDGSRVHIVTLPSALQGTTITIRKFPEKRLTIDDLIRFGSLTRDVADFLDACVKARLNIVVSGGTGSGKTTLLNVLSAYIPDDERIVTIEDSAELQLNQRHVVRLETAPPVPGSADGKTGMLTIRDLVRGSLRMRPDRIVIGECRSGEALDMLQAMNTGHDGSLTTVHANSPRDALARLETLVMMSGMELPLFTIRRQITSAIDLIIQQTRLKDGARKITQITEIQGMEGESITFQDLFIYKLPGQRGNEAAVVSGGKLEPTGFRPRFSERLEDNGFKLSGRMFGVGGGQAPRP